MKKNLLAALIIVCFAILGQAATNYVGQLLQTVNLTQVGGTAVLTGNGTSGAGALRVNIASDNTAFSVNALESGIWTVQPGNTANTTAWLFTNPAASAPTITKVGATTTSASLIAANSTRKAIEIDTDCANTDAVAINFGAGAAVYASHKQMPACTSWAPPSGVVMTAAIQVISNTGTQQVRVIEYP